MYGMDTPLVVAVGCRDLGKMYNAVPLLPLSAALTPAHFSNTTSLLVNCSGCNLQPYCSHCVAICRLPIAGYAWACWVANCSSSWIMMQT
jgi:hypothetical protein